MKKFVFILIIGLLIISCSSNDKILDDSISISYFVDDSLRTTLGFCFDQDCNQKWIGSTYNPYLKLNYEKVATTSLNSVNYDLSKEPIRKVIETFWSGNVSELDTNFFKQVLTLGTTKEVYRINNGKAYAIFTCTIYPRYGGAFLAQSVVVGLDEKGGELFELGPIAGGVNKIEQTKSGKYLVMGIGDVVTGVDYTLVPAPYYQIISDNGEVVAKINGDSDISPFHASVYGDLILVKFRARGGYKYRFYDINANKYYERDFTRDELGTLDKVTEDSLIFKSGNNYSIGEDFKVVDM